MHSALKKECKLSKAEIRIAYVDAFYYLCFYMNKYFSKIHIAVIGILALLISGCSSSHDNEPDEPVVPDIPVVEEPSIESRTIIVYMVASNDLGSRRYDDADINEMIDGMKRLADASNRRLLVYHHPYGSSTPELKEIDAEGNITMRKTYDGTDPSVSITRMRNVVNDAKTIAPADSYGIIFWSHGTGWLAETSAYNDPALTTYSFGSDNGRRMTVPALAQALSGNIFDFIYFDCCLMGTVEVVYELRDSARKIVAMCTELPLEGMPYDDNIPLLFDFADNAPELAAASTYDYYCSPEASNNSITLGVYDVSAVENLARSTRLIMETGLLPAESYTGVPMFRTSVVATGAYDMGDFIRSLGASSALLNSWNKAYSDFILYKATTPRTYGLDMSRFTGIGCNIATSAKDNRLNYGYRDLQWWHDVTSHNPYLY